MTQKMSQADHIASPNGRAFCFLNRDFHSNHYVDRLRSTNSLVSLNRSFLHRDMSYETRRQSILLCCSQAMEWTANIYKNCPSTSTFKQSVKTYLFNRAYCWCLIVDCLERLRTAGKADIWRYIKCFILLLLLLLLCSTKGLLFSVRLHGIVHFLYYKRAHVFTRWGHMKPL